MCFKIYLIGVSEEGLGAQAQALLKRAEKIICAKGLLSGLKIPHPNKVFTYQKLEEAFSLLKEAQKESFPVAFLASGDPLFFGIGRLLLEHFGPEVIEIHPALSFAQLAAARFKLPWDDFFFVSLHGAPRKKRSFLLEEIPGLLRVYGKVGIFTDPVNTPSRIAAYLKDRVPEEDLVFLVAERLGFPEEKLHQGRAGEIAAKEFATPNLVFLLYSRPKKAFFGFSDQEIAHPEGLLSKEEVRAVVVHKLRLPEQGVFWDVGAGAGGVSCEVAGLKPLLRVFAVEKEKARFELLCQNRKRLGLLNLEPIKGSAPQVLFDLPSPARTFVGGSGGKLLEILELCSERTRGRIVATFTLLENLATALTFFKSRGMLTEVIELQVSRSKALSGGEFLKALNPVFVVVAKPC